MSLMSFKSSPEQEQGEYLALARAALSRLPGSPPPPELRSPPDPKTVARFLGLPLDRFAQEGCPLEVRVPWHSETLWFVPSEADAEALVREGVSRGRVWTARELLDLLAVPGLTRGQAQTVAQVKATFDGEVVEGRTVTRPEGKR